MIFLKSLKDIQILVQEFLKVSSWLDLLELVKPYQFDATLTDIQKLSNQLSVDLARAAPTISNLNEATAQAASASRHINNLVSACDTPTTITDLKQTVSNARSLTQTFDAVGGDVEKLTADPQFMAAVRSVTIGLGQFFHELYPASMPDVTKP